MLTWEDDVEAAALRRQGWSISAIARHLGRDRQTVSDYLTGKRVPGKRARTAADPFDAYVEYCTIRLADDPHVWASTLFDEVVALGYVGSYPSFTRGLRGRRLRPHCEPCRASTGRDHQVIEHPPGAETQFDWLELPDPPPSWEAGSEAHLLVGVLPHSGAWRAVFAESEDQPHLVQALDAVVRRLGGVSRRWRFDRMATVCYPGSGRIIASFAQVAKHYGVGVDICPPRHGNRKGSVEKGNHSLAQRCWRTIGDELSPAQAQSRVDAFCVRADGRVRRRGGVRTTVGQLLADEGLRPAPSTGFPVVTEVPRVVSAQALVAFAGNFYSIGPGMAGATVTVRHRLGEDSIDIVTASGVVLAVHRREIDGAGVIARHAHHVTALETAVLSQFSDRAPCRNKARRPPSAAARAEADRLAGKAPPGQRVVVDFAAYIAAAQAAATPPTGGGNRR